MSKGSPRGLSFCRMFLLSPCGYGSKSWKKALNGMNIFSSWYLRNYAVNCESPIRGPIVSLFILSFTSYRCDAFLRDITQNIHSTKWLLTDTQVHLLWVGVLFESFGHSEDGVRWAHLNMRKNRLASRAQSLNSSGHKQSAASKGWHLDSLTNSLNKSNNGKWRWDGHRDALSPFSEIKVKHC